MIRSPRLRKRILIRVDKKQQVRQKWWKEERERKTERDGERNKSDNRRGMQGWRGETTDANIASVGSLSSVPAPVRGRRRLCVLSSSSSLSRTSTFLAKLLVIFRDNWRRFGRTQLAQRVTSCPVKFHKQRN